MFVLKKPTHLRKKPGEERGGEGRGERTESWSRGSPRISESITLTTSRVLTVTKRKIVLEDSFSFYFEVPFSKLPVGCPPLLRPPVAG